jgi:hypothetical protein
MRKEMTKMLSLWWNAEMEVGHCINIVSEDANDGNQIARHVAIGATAGAGISQVSSD